MNAYVRYFFGTPQRFLITVVSVTVYCVILFGALYLFREEIHIAQTVFFHEILPMMIVSIGVIVIGVALIGRALGNRHHQGAQRNQR